MHILQVQWQPKKKIKNHQEEGSICVNTEVPFFSVEQVASAL